MKSGLFDRNGKEIKVGDKYKTYKYDTIYTVFWKGGAICGGKTFDICEPLGWVVENDVEDCQKYYELSVDNLDWLELITINED